MKETVIGDILDDRCRAGKFFTYAGPVLLAVNPRDPHLKNDIFAPHRLTEYTYDAKKVPEQRPHLFSVTLAAYTAMKTEKKNQVVTFLGDRGSGKSTLARHAVEHLLRVKPDTPKALTASRLQEIHAALDILGIVTQHTSIEDRGIFTHDNAAFVIKVLYDPQK